MYLEMRAGNAARNLFEECLLNFYELSRFRNVEDLFNLSEKHDFLLWTSLGPVLEQTANHFLGQSGILLEELDYAVSQLGVVQRQTFDLVQRQQHLDQELLVFAFQWQGKSIDYANFRRSQKKENQ